MIGVALYVTFHIAGVCRPSLATKMKAILLEPMFPHQKNGKNTRRLTPTFAPRFIDASLDTNL